ncbi:MAG: inositol monophosphatase family protein [Acidimicrobiales bacterium]
MTTLGSDLALALEMADHADQVTMARWQAGDLAVETKEDFTPVTDADRATETLLRRILAEHRPGQAIVGEEEGAADIDGSSKRWILDPIDGTKNYVRGVPVWGTLIGVECDGAGVVGVVSAPALGRRWWASTGGGAWTGGSLAQSRRLAVSNRQDLESCWLGYDDVPGFEAVGLGGAFGALCRRCERTRAFGDFWSHMMVAEGTLDAAVEPEVAHWDVAAVAVIVAEAGGVFTDMFGRSRADGGSAVSTNGHLHRALLEALPRAATGSGEADSMAALIGNR